MTHRYDFKGGHPLPLGPKALAEDAAGYGHGSVVITYGPFDGDGRRKVVPGIALPNTTPKSISDAQAVAMIDRLLTDKQSAHSARAETLWVLLTWLQTHKVPYCLKAVPNFGYEISLMDHPMNGPKP